MAIFWLTGMPCSGKTTIGRALVERLGELGRVACLIDGDVVRRGELSSGLGFSAADRRENVRRVAGLAARLAGDIDVVVAMGVADRADPGAGAGAARPGHGMAALSARRRPAA